MALKKTIAQMTDAELIQWIGLAPHQHSELERELVRRLEIQRAVNHLALQTLKGEPK